MSKRLAVAAVLLMSGLPVSGVALGAEDVFYQLDLVPSGKLISRDLPALKGASYVFHQYPSGTLISVRKSTVKKIAKIAPAVAAAVNPVRIVPIGDLAMQGPRDSGGRGPANMGRAREAVSAGNAGTAARTAFPPD